MSCVTTTKNVAAAFLSCLQSNWLATAGAQGSERRELSLCQEPQEAAVPAGVREDESVQKVIPGAFPSPPQRLVPPRPRDGWGLGLQQALPNTPF